MIFPMETRHSMPPLSYIDTFQTMMFNGDNIGVLLLFAVIIIPGMIWTVSDYKPDDTMGHISAVLMWCGCCFFALLSPLSILLFFFYRWLFKKMPSAWSAWKHRSFSFLHKLKDILLGIFDFLASLITMSAFMIWVSIYAIILNPLSCLFKWIKSAIRNKRASKVTQPVCINCTASSIAPSAQKNAVSYSHRVCENIWSELDSFVQNVDPTLDRRKQLYLWGIYFYVVVKTVKDQRFINDVYSHFDTCAFNRVVDAESRPNVIHNLRQLYREIRIPLNQSRIDPTTEDGLARLWEFTSTYLYEGLPPPQAKNRFTISVRFLKQLSIFCYSKHKEDAVFSTVRYSISEPSDDFELPNE